jgi:SAM-dependent methyltransferase
MNNYDYCSTFVAARMPFPGARVLDYGCGAGQIVKNLRQQGIDAYGCDVFYEGGDYSRDVPADLIGRVIRRMDRDRIPFEDNSFDWVINNQVFEHVPDIEHTLAEIRRVLRKGGRVLSVFPDAGVWWEGHCGIPFLHWFKATSRTRVWYGTLMRSIGFGYHTEGKSAFEWSRNFCAWLDAWTHYRSYASIRETFEKYLSPPEHFEDDWLVRRLGRFAPVVTPIPRRLQRAIVRRAVELVFVTTKQSGM